MSERKLRSTSADDATTPTERLRVSVVEEPKRGAGSNRRRAAAPSAR
jgi:hypothetical protein